MFWFWGVVVRGLGICYSFFRVGFLFGIVVSGIVCCGGYFMCFRLWGGIFGFYLLYDFYFSCDSFMCFLMFLYVFDCWG